MTDVVNETIKETIFVVDWDGVVCEAVWPEWGNLIPGAVEGLKTLARHGRVRIHSSRLNPYKFGFDGVELRDSRTVEQDIAIMRAILDEAGLDNIEIHTTHGKPTGHYYIDDRAVEFKGSWEEVLDKILVKETHGELDPEAVDSYEEQLHGAPARHWSEGVAWSGLRNELTPEQAQSLISHGLGEYADVLPTGSQERKDIPLTTGVLDYFPAALAEVAKVSKIGNDKHNPGEPLHWARGKSTDQADCIARHLLERGGIDPDTGMRHSAQLAWRCLALLQLELEEAGEAPLARGAREAS